MENNLENKKENDLKKYTEICNRLPYGLRGKCTVNVIYNGKPKKETFEFNIVGVNNDDGVVRVFYSEFDCCGLDDVKLLLRPICDMSEEEVDMLFKILKIDPEQDDWLKVNDIGIIRLFTQRGKDFYEIADAIDYLNKIHVDYRGLIEKGLAVAYYENIKK